MEKFKVRPIKDGEVEKIASFISGGYYDDVYFHWVVDKIEDRHDIVKAYYVEYASAPGAVVHVAENASGELIGPSVWLPHDLDPEVSKRVYEKAGEYAPQFKQVGHKSSNSCPDMEPFYELVAVVSAKTARGTGVGAALLKYHLDILDEKGIPTYLEASTPYHGDGVYAKFGYQQVSELLVFAPTAVLYPLWRPARPIHRANFAGATWRVLNEQDDEVLLLADFVLENKPYHSKFEKVTWEICDLRNYLNNEYYNTFNEVDKEHIQKHKVKTRDNPWYYPDGGESTKDYIFCLSVDEIVRYFGDAGQYKNSINRFFIDDIYNDARVATTQNGEGTRWLTRTPGNCHDMVAVVTVEGKILVTGDFVNRGTNANWNVGVRPAMWVKKAGAQFGN